MATGTPGCSHSALTRYITLYLCFDPFDLYFLIKKMGIKQYLLH